MTLILHAYQPVYEVYAVGMLKHTRPSRPALLCRRASARSLQGSATIRYVVWRATRSNKQPQGGRSLPEWAQSTSILAQARPNWSRISCSAT